MKKCKRTLFLLLALTMILAQTTFIVTAEDDLIEEEIEELMPEAPEECSYPYNEYTNKFMSSGTSHWYQTLTYYSPTVSSITCNYTYGPNAGMSCFTEFTTSNGTTTITNGPNWYQTPPE